jgi:hypothetical protein
MAIKINAQWIVGFVDGEGCFRASIIKNSQLKFKTQIQIKFVVTQHKRDIELIQALKNRFQCGQVSILKKKSNKLCKMACS